MEFNYGFISKSLVNMAFDILGTICIASFTTGLLDLLIYK